MQTCLVKSVNALPILFWKVVLKDVKNLHPVASIVNGLPSEQFKNVLIIMALKKNASRLESRSEKSVFLAVKVSPCPPVMSSAGKKQLI